MSIERAVGAYLTPLLDGAWVGTKVPNPRPERLVKIARAGGPRANIAQENPMVTVECWAEHDADLFVDEVKDLVYAMPGKNITYPTREGFATLFIYGVSEVGGVVNHPDPETRTPRYQFTVQIRHSH